MIKIKTYYIKQGRVSIFKKIQIKDMYCKILKKIDNQTKTKKVVQQMVKSNIQVVILSKRLYENKEFVKQLKANKIIVLEGKWLYKYLISDIIEYICKKNNIENNIEVALLTNEVTDEFLGNIEELSKKFKKTKIVTEHPEKFRKIEQRALETSGLSMCISQNKKQALTKSKIIINFDLSEETINQYSINDNAIIINLGEELKIKKKRFNGIIIKDYEIKTINNIENSDEETLNEFYAKHIKESQIYEKSLVEKRLEEANLSKFYIVRRIIEDEQIEIKELYGKNRKCTVKYTSSLSINYVLCICFYPSIHFYISIIF
ncbi:MAG: hypothetical protein HFJ47_01430 [Clostridia bacterium]|nr:hypothetical protein [Clostridia bacterium]